MDRVFYYTFTLRKLGVIGGAVVLSLALVFMIGRWTAPNSASRQVVVASQTRPPDLQDHEALDSVLVGRSADSYTIQIGAFRSQANATDLASNYESKGYEPYVLNTTDEGGTSWYSVRLGIYQDKDQARKVADQLLAQDTSIREVLVRPVNVL
ncbi:MAG: SPOR domain-containing protein [Candidatus Latescibacteria bacterium]|jgi:cell division septation protein DedD|nr:SPOR domain-containing protein [Candidatus Latescibacterota bacterium]